jgi:hypothetical protein
MVAPGNWILAVYPIFILSSMQFNGLPPALTYTGRLANLLFTGN